MITIIVNGKEKQYAKGTNCYEISKDFEQEYAYPIMGALLNNDVVGLEKKIAEQNSILQFLDLSSREGNMIYEKGLIYLYTYAIKELYNGTLKVRIEHSLDKGIYTTFNMDINEQVCKEIKEKMEELRAKELRIEEMTISRKQAIDYFQQIGRKDKADCLQYISNTYIKLYKMGNSYDYFYGIMPFTTKYITDFDVKQVDSQGMILLYPNIYHGNEIHDYMHHELLYQEFNRYNEWALQMGLTNVYDLNATICQGKGLELILTDEAFQNYRLLNLAEKITKRATPVKLILISGPSSSGKTTTSKKLSMYLKGFGKNVCMLSLDDYFLERDQTPIDEEGKKDYESVKAIDLALFNQQLVSLLKGEEVLLPTYNFIEGKKEYKRKLKLKENDILLVEGLHTLNDQVTNSVPKEQKIKIYLSPLTQLNLDDYNRVSTTDVRLLRRMTRDNRMRGHNASKTLESWKSVRKGEEKYVFPYQDQADIIFNTALLYELAVIKTYIEPLLFSVKKEDPNYKEAIRLLDLLRSFVPISGEDVPKESILREFIGNSCF